MINKVPGTLKFLSTRHFARFKYLALYGLLVIITRRSLLFAEGRKPEEKTEPKATARSAKDGANEALDDMSKGLHKAGHAAKEGANEALEAVDKEVHKVVGSGHSKKSK